MLSPSLGATYARSAADDVIDYHCCASLTKPGEKAILQKSRCWIS